MKPLAAVLLLLGCGCLVTGCAIFAKRLELGTVTKVQPGITTRAEVEKRLGHPKETVTGPNGKTVMRYFFEEFQRSTDVSWNRRRFEPGQILFRTLTLSYGASNIVERKQADESLTPVYHTNAWFSAGPRLTSETIAFVQIDSTKESEAVAKFGPPSLRSFNGEGKAVLVWFSMQTRESTWSDPDIQKLIVVLDEQRVVRSFLLVEHAETDSEPLKLH